MKIAKKGIENITNQNTVAFQLDNSGGHLFSVLSELYSKPEESTLRELSTNAADAHIMSNNQDRPFIINLPNFEKNIYNFSVRDFGPGLSHDQVLNIYRVYGKSTKTDSDEETGCLGLGSKSPFSISSTFYVKSFKDGICSQYTCSMGNDGIPKITEEPMIFETFEENGLEVIVPIYKEIDFKNIIANTLKYFKVKPLVYIQQPELESNTLINIDWPKQNEYIKITDTISINLKSLKVNNIINELEKPKNLGEVIQLQVYYPLDSKIIFDTIDRFNKLYTNEQNEIISKYKISDAVRNTIEILFKLGFKLDAKPSSIAFAPSRETIKYNEITLIYIIKELIKAANFINKIINSKFEKINTFKECFEKILLDNTNYSKIKKYFKHIEKFPNIQEFEKQFVQFLPSGNLITCASNINPIAKGILNYNDGINAISEIALSNIVRRCYNDKYLEFQYINIWDTNRLHFSNTYKDTLIFSFCTPFMDNFIKSMYRKLFYISLHKEYLNLSNIIKEITLDSNDKLFCEIPDTYNQISLIIENFSLNNINEIKTHKEITYRNIMDTLENITVFDFIELIAENSKNLKKSNNLNNLTKSFFEIKEVVSVFIKQKDYFQKFDTQKVSIKNCVTEINNFPVQDFNINKILLECSKTFAKLYFAKERFKKKFPEMLEDSRSKVGLNNFIDNKLKASVDTPLSKIFVTKTVSSEFDTTMAQYIMFYLFKLYPQQVDEQIKYEQNNFDANVKEWLIKRNLPVEYTSKIYTLSKFKPTINKKSSSQKLNFVNLHSYIYYYDFKIDETLFNTFKNLIREMLQKTEEFIFIGSSEYNKHCISSNLNHKIDFLTEATKIKNYYKDSFNDLNNILQTKENIYIKYNTYLTFIQTVKKYMLDIWDLFEEVYRKFDIPRGEFLGTIKKNINKFDLVIDNKRININSIYIDNIAYCSIPDYIINKKNFDLSMEYLYDPSSQFLLSSETTDKNLERFVTENKVCNFEEFKINYGMDYLLTLNNLNLEETKENLELIEKINSIWRHDELIKTLGDAKTRVIRNDFFNSVSHETYRVCLKDAFPEVVFTNIKDIPNKLKKHLINPISITIKLWYSPSFIEFREFLATRRNLITGRNYLLFSSPMETESFNCTDLRDKFKNAAFLNMLPYKLKAKSLTSFKDLLTPWTKKYKRFEFDFKRYLHNYSYIDEIYKRIIKLINPNIFEKDKIYSVADLKELDKNGVQFAVRGTALNSYNSLFNELSKMINKFKTLNSPTLIDEQTIENYYTDLKTIMGKKMVWLDALEVERKSSFSELLINLDEFLKYSYRTEKFNVSKLKEVLEDYYSPKKEEILSFKNAEDFKKNYFDNLNKRIFHYKINSRTDKKNKKE